MTDHALGVASAAGVLLALRRAGPVPWVAGAALGLVAAAGLVLVQATATPSLDFVEGGGDATGGAGGGRVTLLSPHPPSPRSRPAWKQISYQYFLSAIS